MEQSQVALKLMLDGLGVPSTITTVEERKTVQKAVYLGQLAGADLGYRYNWYRMGPYSPGLTRDYFALASALQASDGSAAGGYELRPGIKERLTALRPLLDVPADVELSRADWLELVASIHFLLTQRRMQISDARKTLQSEKPKIVSFTDKALAALKNGGLLTAA